MAISTAVGLDRRSTIIGYSLSAGNFASSTPNLPQSILVVGQANTDKVSGLTLDAIERSLTTKEVGDKYGYGSPLHRAMRILKPNGSDGVGGIPVFFSAQSDSSVTETVKTISVIGSVTGSHELSIQIGGRSVIDGSSLNVVLQDGDTHDDVMTAIRDAVNNCTSCEYTAVYTAPDTEVELTSKFKGLNSNVRIDISLPTGTGLTVSTATTSAGAGSPSVQTTLDNIGDKWITMVVNTYSPESTSILDEIQLFNGMPGSNPTGRYSGLIMKPFVSFTGIITQTHITSALTYASGAQNQDTHSFAPGYGTKGSVYEVAASIALNQAVIAQNDPSKDVINTYLTDIPEPYDLVLAQPTYDVRDFNCRAGVSTVSWDETTSSYQLKDLITTYRVITEVEPSFRWVRDVYIDFNMKFKYYLMQENFVVGKVIVPDNSPTPSNIAGNSISPKVFRSLVLDLIDEMESDGLITDREFSKQSLQVEIDSTNPNRFNCIFNYKRTGIARITSTSVLAGHFFG